MQRRQSLHAALAQLVEHRIRNAGVVGSNPISGTIFQTVIEPTFFGGQIGKPIFNGSNPISGTIFLQQSFRRSVRMWVPRIQPGLALNSPQTAQAFAFYCRVPAAYVLHLIGGGVTGSEGERGNASCV
jgi:hypothetical protein